MPDQFWGSDLYVGLLIMLFVSAVLFVVGWSCSCHLKPTMRYVVVCVAIAGIVGYTLWLRDNMLLARLLPFSNLIILGNWFMLIVSFLAGVAWEQIKNPIWRKMLSTSALIGCGFFSLVHPLLGEAPQCRSKWVNGVCLQTHDRTCSPACAATLLASKGIISSEAEMTQLCLTREGTLWQGMYRGLKLKTQGTRWTVEIFDGSLEELLRHEELPAILSVGIPLEAEVPEIYKDQYGWTPGEFHSVVLLEVRGPNRVLIGEPSMVNGCETWSVEDLEVLWRNRAMMIVDSTEPLAL